MIRAMKETVKVKGEDLISEKDLHEKSGPLAAETSGTGHCWHQGEVARTEAGRTQRGWAWALPVPQLFPTQVRNNKLPPGPAGGTRSYGIFTFLNLERSKEKYLL